MTILNTTEDYKKLRNSYQKFFRENEIPSFSNLLWQFIINGANATKDVVFSAIHRNNALELIMVEANKAGYYPLHVRFKEDVTYEDSMEVAEELSEELFGSSVERTTKLIFISMQKQMV